MLDRMLNFAYRHALFEGLILLLVLLAFIAPRMAHAQEVSYEYVGSAYTSQGQAFSTGDNLSVILTLNSSLAPNLINAAVSPYMVNLDDSAHGWMGNMAPYLATDFRFSTNGTGQVTGYSFAYAGLLNGISDQVMSSSAGGDYAQLVTGGQVSIASTGLSGNWYVISDPWSRGETLSPQSVMAGEAPEMGARGAIAALLLLGGLLAVFRGRKRIEHGLKPLSGIG